MDKATEGISVSAERFTAPHYCNEITNVVPYLNGPNTDFYLVCKNTKGLYYILRPQQVNDPKKGWDLEAVIEN